jgi:FlaA1/EpsC-like NDP-sugar epimerase
MKMNLNLNSFIKKYVIKRKESLFYNDFLEQRVELQNEINNKSVIVIGGAGTIGLSYIKALLKFKPIKLIVVDINENGLTELVRDIRSSTSYNIPPTLIAYPIDFGDKIFEKIYRNHGPFEIVANFAAHKHVRSEKDIFSIEAMIENNIFKAQKLLKLLLEFPPEHFFCVSSDKAANPVNIMGATKKLMEELIMGYSSQIPITTARFANVAFSNGSLPQGFIDRLNKRQAWSCPLGIKRFFVSAEESGQLCLIASVLGKTGDIFFPKLDENNDMILFENIAKDLLNYLGLQIDICDSEEEAKIKASLLKTDSKLFPVYFSEPDTSGEKPYEEFYTDKEMIDLNRFKNIGIIKNSIVKDKNEIDQILKSLEKFFLSSDVLKSDIVKTLKKYLPNFEHIETGKNLDSKM